MDEERAELQRLQSLFTDRTPIVLNVGGTRFTTSITTMRNRGTHLLSCMFSGRLQLTPDDDGSYFIDRDPSRFPDILNWLRDGQIALPSLRLGSGGGTSLPGCTSTSSFPTTHTSLHSRTTTAATALDVDVAARLSTGTGTGAHPRHSLSSLSSPSNTSTPAGVAGEVPYHVHPDTYKYYHDLRVEAEFFGLSDLVAVLDAQPWGVSVARRAIDLSCDDPWAYEDGPDEIVFSVSKPVQILGVSLCAPLSWYHVRLRLLEVAPHNYEDIRETLDVVDGSFTTHDGHHPHSSPLTVTCYCSGARMIYPGKTYMLSALITGGG